jgi:superfamily II DNA or RNA helicase
LFDDVAAFTDLEGRIGGLGDEHSTAIGDAFEIFFEAFLATQPIMQADRTWLVKRVDPDVRQLLNLPADAKGIDGVYRQRTGDYIPYQVKFRSGRGTLSFTEVAPFLGVTERSAQVARLIVTNANELADDIKARDGVFSLRGIDFDDLTPEDFTAVANWLRARDAPLAKKTPRDDQLAALTRIAETLTSQCRATVVMACGTGKTLVQLWAAERLHAKTVLVLVPSLSLLQQTLAVWSHEHSWEDRFEYLAVCSDPTVASADDGIVLPPHDVDFRVDTDPALVRHFLTSDRDAVKVVFSTYQSTQVVADGVKGLAPFDVGIFDEAHKTTGPARGMFAAALSDENVPIRQRLFFTATPRHYDVRHRDREGDFRVVSMDDASIYGPVAYELTFGDAVQRGIICDYRAIIAAVDSQEVTDFALSHGITLVDGNVIASRWVASLLAVQKAVAATHAAKVITFHTRVRLAKEFASETPRGVGRYLPDFAVDHVNGEMRTSDRRAILQGFRAARSLLVTNARCLTEGVDLPAVDMVAFVDPRRSRIDIAQAMGRAMRRSGPQKQFGYVVVPLLTSGDGTDLEEGSWDEVVDVLNAIREVDGRLVDIIRELREAKGRGEVFAPRRLAERFMVLGPPVALEALEREIYVRVIDRFGVPWDERYGQLVAFRTREGHCNVPDNHHENPQLGWWLGLQRQLKKRGSLLPDRVARLEALGVDWDPHDALWEQWLQELAAFKTQHGHCNVPHTHPENPRLAQWLGNQRQLKRRGTLPPDRVARLETLGVVWEPRDTRWEQRFQELVAFKAREGHCDVPQHRGLGTWLGIQRQNKTRGTLPSDRVSRLESLGVVWDPHDAAWEQRFQELVAFKAREGHCDLPARDPENPQLGMWLSNQRQFKKAGTLSPDRIARLEALGAAWEVLDLAWEKRFHELTAFRAQHGHCNVPDNHPENSRLAQWLKTQRWRKDRGSLSPDHIARLDALGVVWDRLDTVWEERFQELMAIKAQHGHCNVPRAYSERPQLAGWLARQRAARRQGALSPERIARLETLGVVWEPYDTVWEQRFQELTLFRVQHGHCDVPARYSENPVLGRWLDAQRQFKKRGKLSGDRIARLQVLGVVWEPSRSLRND